MSDTTAKPPAIAAPTRAQTVPLNKVTNLQQLFAHPDFADRITKALPKGQNASRMIRTFVLAVQKVPKLMQVSPMSMMGVFTAIATLGLEPNTPLGQCYIIPFDVSKKQGNQWVVERTDAQLIIGYPGYIDLIYRGDKVKDIDCQVVWEGDEFSYEHGTNKHLRHVAKGKPQKPGAEPLYVYMHARMANGGEQFEVMTAADVHRIRARSQGFKTAMAAYDKAVSKGYFPKAYTEAPWIKDPIPMWRKTALRAGQKWLPKTVELAAALSLDDEDTHADFGKIIDADDVVAGAWEPTGGADDEGEQQQTTQHQLTQDAPAMTVDSLGAGTKEPEKVTTNTNTQANAPLQTAQQTVPRTAEVPVLYLVNEDGETVDGGTHRDPVAYVRAVASLWNATAPELRAAIIENNAEFTAQAAAHPVAKKMLEDLEQRAAEPSNPLTVPVPTRGKDQQDLKGYLAACEISTREIGSIDDLNGWRMANEPTYSKMPKVTRTAIESLLQGVRERLGIGTPLKPAEQAQQPAQAQEEGNPREEPPPPDEEGPGLALPAATAAEPERQQEQPTAALTQEQKDDQHEKNFERDIAELKTEFEVRSFDGSASWKAVTGRWYRDDRPRHDRVVAVLRKRFVDLGGELKSKS
jgi:recombination protein RecT